MSWDDEIDDDLEEYTDDEAPDDADVLACPSCGEAVHEEAQQCPHCRDWITPVYAGAQWKHWIWVVAVALVIASFLLPVLFL